MIFDSAGIIRLIHEDAREVKPMERLMTLREVLMSWTIYVSYRPVLVEIAAGLTGGDSEIRDHHTRYRLRLAADLLCRPLDVLRPLHLNAYKSEDSRPTFFDSI